jgi:tyrosine-protein kinase Etk/Wzc
MNDISENGSFEIADTGVELSLISLLMVLQRRWRLVAFFLLTSLFLGGSYALLKTKIYEATAIIAIEEQANSFASGEFDIMGIGAKSFIGQEKITLSSRTIAEEVVRKLKLDYSYESKYDTQDGDEGEGLNPYPVMIEKLVIGDELVGEELKLRFEDGRYEVVAEDFGALGSADIGEPLLVPQLEILVIAKTPKASGVIRVTRMPFQVIVQKLRDSVIVRDLGKYAKGNVLFVDVRDTDPDLARLIANEVTQSYIQRNIDKLGQEAKQTMDFLSEQLDLMQQNLETGEKSLNEFKSEKGVFLLVDEAKALINEISQLEIQRTGLGIMKHQLMAVSNSLKSGKVSRFLLADLSAGSSTAIASMVQSLADNLVALQAMKEELVDDSPKVQRLQAQIDGLKKRIRHAVDNSLSSVNEQIAGANIAVKKYEDKLKNLPETERQMAVLTRTATVNAELYIFLLKAREEARVRRAQVVSNVYIIDPAITPEYPILPRKKLTVMISLLFGLMLGIALAIFIDFRIDPITSGEVLERKYGIPVVTAIPKVKSEDLALAKQAEFKSPLSEATGLLRAHARFTSKGQDSWRILMTSPNPGEGKSTTSMNLATALAASGEKTLLLDCDLRYPRLHQEKKLDIEQDRGLVEVLAGDATLDEVVHREVAQNLDVLTAGKATNFPAEILSSAEMRKLMKDDVVNAGYRYAIIDSPPGVIFSDPIVLSAIVDSVYIVVCAGITQGHSLSLLMSHMRKVSANIKGIVLNQVSSGAGGGYGYGYGYAHKYGYGYGYDKQGYGYDKQGYGYDQEGYGYGGKGKSKPNIIQKTINWLIG